MDRKGSIRRATSAGYRLPERPSVALASQSSVSVKKPPQSAPRNASEPPPERDPDAQDPVKQDRVWRELVRAERDRVKEWVVWNLESVPGDSGNKVGDTQDGAQTHNRA